MFSVLRDRSYAAVRYRVESFFSAPGTRSLPSSIFRDARTAQWDRRFAPSRTQRRHRRRDAELTGPPLRLYTNTTRLRFRTATNAFVTKQTHRVSLQVDFGFRRSQTPGFASSSVITNGHTSPDQTDNNTPVLITLDNVYNAAKF